MKTKEKKLVVPGFSLLKRKGKEKKKTKKTHINCVSENQTPPPATFKNGVAEKVRTLLK